MISFNLLPPQEKKELELAEVKHWLIGFCFEFFAVLIIFILLLLSAYFYLFILLESQIKLIDTTKNKLEIQKLNQVEQQIQGINQKINKIYQLQKEMIVWSPILEEFARLTPDGISITNFSYKISDNQADLNGRADERDSLLLFQKKLEENTRFIEINSPISNLLKQKDIDFRLSFKITQ